MKERPFSMPFHVNFLFSYMLLSFPVLFYDTVYNKIRMQSQQPIERKPQNHSLEADMLTGWKPKLKIIGPMPLNFDNPMVDRSIMALIHQESAFFEVVYLGLRPNSTFKMHQQLAKTYRYKYTYLLHNDFPHLKPFFKKFYSLFEPQVKRPFHGMNPNLPKPQLIFDSLFQSGNLDCVVRLKSHEYDLILRVDSNTAGHVMWYNFKVRNPDPTPKRVKFNIVNLKKSKSAYQRGMRPFVRRQGAEWRQDGYNVEVVEEKLRYHKQNLAILIDQNPHEIGGQYFRKLTFCLDFEPNQTLQIAYSVPYTYSELLQDIRMLKKKAEGIPGMRLEVDLTHESLSGLEIPLLKIYQGQPSSDKYCAFLMGRQHPGESNGSHVLKGSLQRLLSGDYLCEKLLNHCDFVVIPMLNPDGVVAGNFRTSLFGKDPNRLFKTKDTTLLPEIEMARNVLTHCSEFYKKKLLLFLDYHGHSTRRNAFFLGPGILDAQLLNDIRILPKIIASYTEIFRYPSCSFRLEQNKKTTARALFGKMAGLSYTIETSNWSYYSQNDAIVYDFIEQHWIQLGKQIMRGVEEFVSKKIEARKKYDGKVREEEARKIKLKLIKSKNELKFKAITDREKVGQFSANVATGMQVKNKEIRSHTETKFGEAQQVDQEQFLEQKQQKARSEVKQANSSDEMSERGMDSDCSAEDMEKEKFKKYIRAASDMLVEFEEIYYGENYRKGMSKYRANAQHKSNKLLAKDNKEKRKKNDAMQACLRPSEAKRGEAISDHFAKQFKKKLFLEDEHIRDSLSKANSEYREFNDTKRKLFIEPLRKAKIRIGGEIKEEIGFTEQLRRVQKIHKVEIQKESLSKRKRRLPETPPKVLPGSSPLLIVNSKNLNLPSIKDSSKSNTDKLVSNTSNILKTHDKMAELLSVEDNINKSTVLNVLRLSRVEIDSNYYI